MPSKPRGAWDLIVADAATIAGSYTTAVTLRQLHYRLVAAGLHGYQNTQSDYKRLSSLTAEARRDGTFPSLSDRTRGVSQPLSFDDQAEALDYTAAVYRLDRTIGQKDQIWVLFEKATLQAQIESWTDDMGLPVAAMRGYSSESLEAEIFDAMTNDGRGVVALYVGDLDPEGEDIERNFLAQADRQGISFVHWERLAVDPSQIGPLGLVPNPGKATSSRAPKFTAKYGRLFQIEVEAIDPNVLEQLVRDGIAPFWRKAPAKRVLAQEAQERKALRDLARQWRANPPTP